MPDFLFRLLIINILIDLFGFTFLPSLFAIQNKIAIVCYFRRLFKIILIKYEKTKTGKEGFYEAAA